MKLDNALPSSPEAEQGVLSSFLQSPEPVFELILSQGVQENWFMHPVYATVFQGLMQMRKENRVIDMTTATDFFVRNAENYPIGEPSHVVTELFVFTPSAANVSHYLDILRECYAQRLGIIACNTTERAIREAKTLQDVFNATTGVFNDTVKVCEEHQEIDWDKEALKQFIDKMEDMQAGKFKTNLIKTTLTTLNEEVGGLAIGELTIITGLPSTGKSVLGNNFVRCASVEQRRKSMIFSMEMPTDQLIRRMVADLGSVRMSAMRMEGQLLEHERKAFVTAVSLISKGDISFRDSKSVDMSIGGIEAAIRKQKKNKGVDLVLIDYLQLIKTKSQKDKRRDEELSEASAHFKRLALELDLAIILIAAENKEGGVRGSHGVEYDADSIHRMVPVKNKEGRVETTSGVYVEKCREGRRGYTIPVELDGQHQRIIETGLP